MDHDVKFSFDGSQWAFPAPTSDQFKVVSSAGESPAYIQIRDLVVTAQGAAFVGVDANGQWWLHVGSRATVRFLAADSANRTAASRQ